MLPITKTLIREVQSYGVPVIYFGVETASLLPAMRETGADVLGLDWRTPLGDTWRSLDYACAVQGNLDPITLFAEPELIRERVKSILTQAGGRPGHIFNLGHGIVPGHPGRERAARRCGLYASCRRRWGVGDRAAVLLLAHGTADTLDEIPEYLSNVTGGRPLPESVIEEIRHRYSLIGSSPLTRLTQEQGRLLANELDVPVYVGMRNWRPYIKDTIQQMVDDGITSAVVICLAPQNSRTSVGLYKRAVETAAGDRLRIDFVEGWADDLLLAEAFAERLRPLWHSLSSEIGDTVPVLFTAHSVPLRTVEPGPDQPADPYAEQAMLTAEYVADCVPGLKGLAICLPKSGMSGGPWIGPTVEETLTELRKGRAHRGDHRSDRLSLRSRRDSV